VVGNANVLSHFKAPFCRFVQTFLLSVAIGVAVVIFRTSSPISSSRLRISLIAQLILRSLSSSYSMRFAVGFISRNTCNPHKSYNLASVSLFGIAGW